MLIADLVGARPVEPPLGIEWHDAARWGACLDDKSVSRGQVTAQATYRAPDLIDVTVDGPDGSTSRETVAATGDIASSARKQAEVAWGSTRIGVDLRTSTPPWLAEGDLVRLTGSAVDPDAGNEPYGQIVGFLIVGGVLIVQAGAGAGIHAPGDLTVVHAEDLHPKTLTDIKERAGEPPV